MGEGQPERVAPEAPVISRRSCPITVVRRPVLPMTDKHVEPWPQPSSNGGSYNRSYSSSVVTINGRVVSRRVYPPPSSDDDDDQ